MEIIFGQDFDQGYYLDYSLPANQHIFNSAIVGPMGLLNLMERELGLTGSFLSGVERKISYQKICKAFLLQNLATFFSKSFENDPGGVTAELLKMKNGASIAAKILPAVTGAKYAIMICIKVWKRRGKQKKNHNVLNLIICIIRSTFLRKN